MNLRHTLVVTTIAGLLLSAGACGLQLQGNALLPKNEAGVLDATSTPANKVDSAFDGSFEPEGGDAEAPGLADDPGEPRCDALTAPNSVVRQTTRSLTVDGLANDWAKDTTWQPIAGSSNPASTALCADFAIRWDPDSIHVLARVKDTMHVRPPLSGTDLFFNDAVEIFVGPPSPNADGRFRNQDKHYIVDFSGQGMVNRGDGTNRRFEALTSSASFAFAAAIKPWGYVIETRISRAELVGPAFSSTTPYIFNIAAVDGTKTMQTQYMLWSVVAKNVLCADGVVSQPAVGLCCGLDATFAFCNSLRFAPITFQ
jgi:Carbohydrate family 9 binding domain-like